MQDFYECIRAHAQFREQNAECTPYWVCAYTNRQHELGLEIGSDPREAFFYKAMGKSEGVLLVLDPISADLHGRGEQNIYIAMKPEHTGRADGFGHARHL